MVICFTQTKRNCWNGTGVDFEVLPASGDENRISDNPGEAVKQLASDKAASVIRTMKDSADGTIVIGSDTVVVFENCDPWQTS